MGEMKYLSGHCRPSSFMRQIIKHTGDVSEGSEHKILAIRTIVGKKVTFYRNGYRRVRDLNLTEEDTYDSEILRLAHASILIGEAIGKKSYCYVDATVEPVEVWIYGMKAEQFLSSTKKMT